MSLFVSLFFTLDECRNSLLSFDRFSLNLNEFTTKAAAITSYKEN